MEGKEPSINTLIEKAIKASTDFEALMDSIDFDSYIPNRSDQISTKEPKKLTIYFEKTHNAQNICENILNHLKRIENVFQSYSNMNEEDQPQYLVWKLIEEKKNLITILGTKKQQIKIAYYQCQLLIWNLFEAKKIRLAGRKQFDRKSEIAYYQRAKYILHNAFDTIERKYFINEQKNKTLKDNFNWAKVLYFNELSICYSGLAESSMSLGYAEESCSLLRVMYKNLQNKDISIIKDGDTRIKDTISLSIKRLYTFALYNKGEAERNLHDDDKAQRTFHEILDNWNGKAKKTSDFYQASLRIGSILIDHGRSEEAINIFKKVKVQKNDIRAVTRDLEKASALIDQKEYSTAYKLLNKIERDSFYKQTFACRKASLFRIRCLIEYKRNKPTELETIKVNKKRLIKKFEEIPSEIIGTDSGKISGIINECIINKDGVNFKKACKYYSEFYELKNKIAQQKFIEYELLGYFMYLFYEKLEDKYVEILNEKKWKSIEDKIYKIGDSFNEILRRIDDSEYLEDFFHCYLKADNQKEAILEKLLGRIKILLKEMDRLEKLDKIEKDFLRWKKSTNDTDENLTHAKDFITKSFFHTESPVENHERKYLSPCTIEKIINKNLDRFKTQVIGSSKQILPLNGNSVNGILTVLRRWNSFTPGLSSIASPSKGGGYFLYFRDEKNGSKGIVIDPGHDFLANLFSEGFTINDIDVILLSHAHPDHTDNFPKILSLFHEMNGRLKERGEKRKDYDRKHIKVILTPGVYDIFSKRMRLSKKSLKDIFVVDFNNINEAHDPVECYNYSIGKKPILKIKAFKTSHSDLDELGSIGFLFEFGNNETKIGFTCDAQWNPNFWKIFKDCSIICAHLGSLVNIDKDKNFCSTFCTHSPINCKDPKKCIETNFSNVNVVSGKIEKQTHDENHLYLGGIASFFYALLKNNDKFKLGIISEFGEELKGGIRIDFYHKFDDWFKDNKDKKCRCLPADIGLRIDIFSGDIFCHTCHSYVDREEIVPIAYGKEEAIFFICKECLSVLSTNQIEEKLKDYYENGRQLALIE